MKNSQLSYHKGVAAENIAQKHYVDQGHTFRETRMKTTSGEIDLIMEKGNEWVFVEVKHSKTFARAAQRITTRQTDRIHNAARDHLARMGLWGLVDCRFDAALVDEHGRVKVIENAFI